MLIDSLRQANIPICIQSMFVKFVGSSNVYVDYLIYHRLMSVRSNMPTRLLICEENILRSLVIAACRKAELVGYGPERFSELVRDKNAVIR
jgi:hypothetical protein